MKSPVEIISKNEESAILSSSYNSDNEYGDDEDVDCEDGVIMRGSWDWWWWEGWSWEGWWWEGWSSTLFYNSIC